MRLDMADCVMNSFSVARDTLLSATTQRKASTKRRFMCGEPPVPAAAAAARVLPAADPARLACDARGAREPEVRASREPFDAGQGLALAEMGNFDSVGSHP
ncbi:hypothetical protein CATMQ487_32900 [Sphaerotilus microaerophilus]|uniref:Uncharacterized protein n=1 Tax=Sphaerotilus microaerophilus TaxID=2914710 RepID=A0ABN6PMA5_9BURK|nr:hypothetical protein CATMQ487_32900 [Sphaerotilus sp. FB-5]